MDNRSKRFVVEPGVLWITGLAGAGKTTLADAVCSRLKGSIANIVRVDGDAVREICGNDLGYSEDERLKNAYRLARFCKLLCEQELFVLCSTISLFAEIWTWNRNNMSSFRTVYIQVALEELRRRNKSGLYESPVERTTQQLIESAGRFTRDNQPDILIDNTFSEQFESNVDTMISFLGFEEILGHAP